MIPSAIKLQLSGEIPAPQKTGVDWYLFSWFLDRYQNKPMLEIGAGDGGSTLTMAAYTNDFTVIDSWEPGWPKSAVQKLADLAGVKIKFIDSKSNQVDIRELQIYSMIHLDANKSYDGTIEDLTLCEKICDGVICVDDYMQSMWPEVTWAVDDWLKKSRWHRVLIGNHQVFLSRDKIVLKEIIVDFPVIDRNNGLHLTYGQLPNKILPFIDTGVMKYTWHDLQSSYGKQNGNS